MKAQSRPGQLRKTRANPARQAAAQEVDAGIGDRAAERHRGPGVLARSHREAAGERLHVERLRFGRSVHLARLALRLSAGKCPSLVAEELRFEEIRGNR